MSEDLRKEQDQSLALDKARKALDITVKELQSRLDDAEQQALKVCQS